MLRIVAGDEACLHRGGQQHPGIGETQGTRDFPLQQLGVTQARLVGERLPEQADA